MRYIVLFLFIVNCPVIIAQQVIATAGNSLISPSGSISYTIGEGIAQTLTNGEKTLTQGFQQSNITVSIIKELTNPGFEISVYPNPVSSELTIRISEEDIPGLQIHLSDISGKLIYNKNINSMITKISVSQLPAGFYIIKVTDSTKELKTFKIVKE